MNKEFFYLVATDQKKGIHIVLLKCILALASFIYAGGLFLHKLSYRLGICKKVRLPKPVISVGNITVGGVGKTPFVMYLLDYLLSKGVKPVVLTRGYMIEEGAVSDEAAMMRMRYPQVPILVGANRAGNAEEFLKKIEADVFILDDGFQHWRLERDCDFVLIDGMNPYGNGWMLPFGILREPISALNRAESVIITKSQYAGKIPEIPQLLMSNHMPEGLLNVKTQVLEDSMTCEGKNVCIFSSVGNSASFRNSIEDLGCTIKKEFDYFDHYQYKRKDIEVINEYCTSNKVEICITTEKDLVKINNLINTFNSSITLYVLRIKLSIVNNEEKILERVDHILSS